MYGLDTHFSVSQTPNGLVKSYVYDVWTNNTIPQLRFCAPLPTNCMKAVVDASGRILCTSCKQGFLNFDYQCVDLCPEGYQNFSMTSVLIGGLVEGPYCKPCSTIGCKSCALDVCLGCKDGF